MKVVDPPGPKGLPFVGVALQFRANPLRFLQHIVTEYGDVVQLPLLNIPLTPMEPKRKLYVINQPHLIRHICLTNTQKYRTHKQLVERLKGTLQLGEGELLTSDGHKWAQRKRILQPSFQKNPVARVADKVIGPVAAMVERWKTLPQGAVIDVDKEMTQLVTRMFAALFLGVDMEHEDSTLEQDLSRMLRGFSKRMATPFQFLLNVPSKRNREFDQALKAVEDRLYRTIQTRRHLDERPRDCLTMWMEAAAQHGDAGLDDRSLRDQVMLLLLAGRKNVANALSWSFHLLGQYPEAAQKLCDEVDTALRGQLPTPADLQKMPYVKMLYQEVLRLYPTAWLIARACVEDDTVGGYHIPKGATVFMSPYTVHRHPGYWDNPDMFDPERFAEARSHDIAPGSYIPFGVGPRTCIGKFITELQMQAVLTILSQHFILEPKPGHKVKMNATSSLHLKGGLPMILRQRKVGDAL